MSVGDLMSFRDLRWWLMAVQMNEMKAELMAEMQLSLKSVFGLLRCWVELKLSWHSLIYW